MSATAGPQEAAEADVREARERAAGLLAVESPGTEAAVDDWWMTVDAARSAAARETSRRAEAEMEAGS